MKWLEIIELRAAAINKGSLKEQLAQLLDEQKNEANIKIYHNVQIDTDLSIHIWHESDRVEVNGSFFGKLVKELFRNWGLVNHSIWLEQI